ncbi:MAG: zinc ribbon domain-containing protein [Candidatus Hodarchaeota archaeon]
MAQTKSTDYIRHIPKLLKAGAILVIISIFLPATHNFVSESYYGYTFRATELIWYFGLYFYSYSFYGYSDTDFDIIDTEEYMSCGITALILLIAAFILMIVAASKENRENDHKIATVTGLVGGVLAFISLGIYYVGLEQEFPGFWSVGDPSVGFYLPIIGGILGVVGGSMAGYAYSQEQAGVVPKYQPQPVEQPTTVTQVTDQSQKEGLNFCPNCGAELVGPFCRECGTKAY